jgi:replicative DNA helicase
MTDFLPPMEPRNAEAETALIGSVLVAPQYYRECAAVLSGPEDFHDHGWREVWSAFRELDKQDKPIDSLTVMDQLDKSGCNGTVSASDLAGAMNSVPYFKNGPVYAEAVAECAGKRRLLALASDVARMANDPATPLLEALERSQKAITAIPVSHKPTISITDQLLGFTDEVEERMKAPTDVWGISTGFDDIDKKTGGWQRGEMTLWCGQPGIGKSMLLGQMGYLTALKTFCVDYYSLEMRNLQILRRIISHMAGVQTRKMKSGYISNEEWAKIMKASSDLSLLKLRIVDESVISVAQIRADIYEKKQEGGADLVIVDYVGRVHDSEKDPIEKVKRVTNDLKTLADKENVAVIGIHTMPKSGIDSKTTDVQDASGAIENTHNADNVVFMKKHIPEIGEQPNPNMVTLLFSKMRDAEGMPTMNLVKLADRPGFGAVGRREAPDYEWQTRDN